MALIRRVMSGILFSWVSQVAVAQIAVAQTAQEWANVDIVGSLSGHSHPVRVLMASPDGRYLLGLTDYEMALWDVSQGQLIRFLPGHLIDFGDPALAPLQVPARRAAFTADGRFVVSVLDDPGFATIQASLLMWDIATGEHRSLGSYLGCRDVAIAGSRMVTACDDGVQVWDLTTGDQQYVLYSFEQGGRPVETLALSPDGQTLATADLNATGGSEGEDATRIRLWALGESSGDPMAELRGHSSSIAQLAFSGDGRYLVSGGFGQGAAQIIIWDGQTGQNITQLDSQNLSMDGYLVLFALSSGSPLHLLAGSFPVGELVGLPSAEVIRDVLIPRAGGSSAYAFIKLFVNQGVDQGELLAWAGQPPTFANPVVHLFGRGTENGIEIPQDRADYQELSLAETLTYPIQGPLNTVFGEDPEQIALLGLVPLEQIGSTNPEDPAIEIETLESTADKQVVMITLLGLPDDSVANLRYRVEFAPYGADGSWKVIWIGTQTQCRLNRGHQTWSSGLCI